MPPGRRRAISPVVAAGLPRLRRPPAQRSFAIGSDRVRASQAAPGEVSQRRGLGGLVDRFQRRFTPPPDGEIAADEFDPAAPVQVGRVENAGTRDLLLKFENIGNGCEFGLVQRRYGAEPLGLFRWNTVSVTSLIGALGDNLAGIGEPENTELKLSPHGEYLLADRRWGFGMHTWMRPDQVEAADLHRRMCARVAFLRDKFLEDLRTGEKIFVYRAARIGLPKFMAVHDALSAHGPARMLAVLPCGEGERKPRRVVELRERFCAGFIRLGATRDLQWDIPFRDWVSICRKAAAILKA